MSIRPPVVPPAPAQSPSSGLPPALLPTRAQPPQSLGSGREPFPANTAKPALLTASLSAGYGEATVLHDLRFTLHLGEALGLVGTSGAGKSTLLLALLGLLPWRGGWATGQVLFEATDLLAAREKELRPLRGRRFALIPQSPLTSLNGMLPLGKHFQHAWRAHAAWDRGGRAQFHDRVAELLAAVQLPASPEFLARRPGQISVGQAQRVLIAMALLHRPALLLADEPTSALDPVTQAEIVGLLGRLHREQNTALLYISHDLPSVLQLCERAAVLDAGTIVETLSLDSIESEAAHPATLRLLGALPAPAEVLRSHRRVL